MRTRAEHRPPRRPASAADVFDGTRPARRAPATVVALLMAAAATVALPALGGCGGAGGGAGGGSQVCSAVDHGRTLVVRLADDWPAADGRTVVARCSSPCGEVQRDGDELGSEVSGALTGSAVELFVMAMPDSVQLTVLGPEGLLAETERTLAWERVGGTEECGGPMRAVAVVPAP